jgi:hypothetical protein
VTTPVRIVGTGPSRVRPFRVGVMLHETSVFRPLMGISASNDGGIMLWPRVVPGQEWAYIRAEVPSGQFRGMHTQPDFQDAVRTPHPPRIHYHRSGWVTVNLQGHTERRGFRGVPLRSVRGQQWFSFACSNPIGMPTENHKRNDFMGVAHVTWPTTVRVAGYLFARHHLRSYLLDQIPDGAPCALIQDDRAEYVIDLRWHGLDVIVALRVNLLDDEPPFVPGETHSLLAAFDTSSVDFDSAPTVVAWTSDDAVKPVDLTDPADAPFAGPWAPHPAEPLIRRERRPSKG